MGGDFTFSYDARGNLRGRVHSLTGATVTTAYDGLDRVISQGAGAIAYTYLSPRWLAWTYDGAVAALSVVSLLPPAEFRALWSDALRASGTGRQRALLAESLVAFLNRNPGESRHYSRSIRDFCSEGSQVARRAGVLLLSALEKVRGADSKVVMRSLTGRDADARLATLGAIQRWALRGSRAPAEAKVFIQDEEVHRQVARARRDRDKLV